MKRRILFLAAGALAVAVPALTQTAKGDPIAGNWVEDGTAFLRLKHDGRGVVSGQIAIGRAENLFDIKTGSFDAKTGKLKLEGDAKHPDSGATVHFVINGTVKADTVDVQGTFGQESGSKRLIRKTAATSPVAEDAATAATRKTFREVSGWMAKAVDAVPADKYTYKPAATVRSFGQLVAHVLDGYTYYCGQAVGKKNQWSDAIEKGKTDKATVVAALKQAQASCTAAYESGQIAPLIENVAHSHLHYGNVITYMRMMGLVPPSS
jgi:uncharacterized damage-inducible protein DinB